MIRSHMEQIGGLISQMRQSKEQAASGWNDDNSKRFYHKHLEPLEESLNNYRASVDKYMNSLGDAIKEIDNLVGTSSTSFPFDPLQHIRERSR